MCPSSFVCLCVLKGGGEGDWEFSAVCGGSVTSHLGWVGEQTLPALTRRHQEHLLECKPVISAHVAGVPLARGYHLHCKHVPGALGKTLSPALQTAALQTCTGVLFPARQARGLRAAASWGPAADELRRTALLQGAAHTGRRGTPS